MTELEFLKEVETIVQSNPGSIAMDDQLASLAGWDSLAVISLIALADERLNVALNISHLASCKTIGDLARLCEGKVR